MMAVCDPAAQQWAKASVSIKASPVLTTTKKPSNLMRQNVHGAIIISKLS